MRLKRTSFQRWYKTNIYKQKQEGYVTATITLPLGDITGDQLRALADIARRYTNGTVRTTVDQNIVLRWISEGDLPEVYAALEEIGLGQPGAGTIVDITSCPGTDTCKLGISASRGLAGELRQRLAEKSHTMDEAMQNLAYQGQWMFQLLRSTSRCRSWLLWRQSSLWQLHRSAFSNCVGRRMDSQRRFLWSCRGSGSSEANTRSGGATHGSVCGGASEE